MVHKDTLEVKAAYVARQWDKSNLIAHICRIPVPPRQDTSSYENWSG